MSHVTEGYWPAPPEGLAPGDRLADFRCRDQFGIEWQLYERLLGQPLLLYLDGQGSAPLPMAALGQLAAVFPECQLVLMRQASVPDNAALAAALVAPATVLNASADMLQAFAPDGDPRLLVVDANLRVVAAWTALPTAEALRPLLGRTAGPRSASENQAPVLLVPRVLLGDECARLLAWYGEKGGEPSGMPSYSDGQQQLHVDAGAKLRHDLRITDDRMGHWLAGLLSRRLLPEIERAFCWRAQGYESFKLVCYGEQGSGYFRPHRDNLAPQAAHRRFAVTVNLNSGEYSGGELRFPEFGRQGYGTPAGGAVVFSCALAHEVSDITSGRRYALLTFLY